MPRKKNPSITRQPGKKVGLGRRPCLSTICFCICACVCGNMPVRLWSCVWAAHILYKPVQLSQMCFVCTLFSTLVLSLAENNYSLFVSRCDEGRATQTPASFYRFRGRHIAQEERRRGGDNSRRDDIANYSVSHHMSFKPTTSHNKSVLCLTHTWAHRGALYLIVPCFQTAGITVCPN